MDITPDYDRRSSIIVSRVLDVGASRDAVKPMFCQMNRLTDTGTEAIWLEVARWVRYEESLDESASRWSKPHVPALSLRALTTLRQELKHAPLLLAPDVTDFKTVVDKLVAAWSTGGYLETQHVAGIKLALNKPHKHVKDYKKPNLLTVKERGDGGSSVSLQSIEGYKNNSEDEDSNDEDKCSYGTHKKKNNQRFHRKIPKTAVATNILVGELTSLRRPLVALVRLSPSRQLGNLCEVSVPTQFIFICLTPQGSKDHDCIAMGRCLGALMTDPIFRELADHCSTRFEILAGLTEFSNNMTALPSATWDGKTRLEPPDIIPKQDFRRKAKQLLEEKRKKVQEDIIHEEEIPGLTRTGRLFGGLIGDVKRKLPWYASDFRDALHVQCIASTIYLYLATLTPNVTFGGLLGQGTNQYMGTMECILAASVTGVVFALFSGQPLNILGSTGPMLVLEIIIHDLCHTYDWDFLPLRLWIGVWTCLALLLIVAFDLSALTRFITRFTEECFASLIAVIFIFKAFEKVINIAHDYPAELRGGLPVCPTDHNLTTTTATPTTGNLTTVTSPANLTAVTSECQNYAPDVFFLSIIEFLATFVIANCLVEFKNSIFFPKIVRTMLSDFGVLISIILVVGVDAALGVNTPKLEVPQEFRPSRHDRESWVISPFSDKNPVWLIFAAIVPALLATILIFMDQQITAVIINRKDHKLKKSFGYHLDLLVLALLILLLSFLGLPWYVAATVSALAHVQSLKMESDCAAPGEKPEFLGAREQRVTAVLVGILSGLSVFLTAVLKLIPLPVLYGIFLFMGVRALNGMQFIDRLLLFFIPAKHQPDHAYLRHVPLRRVYMFTAIQAVCLVLLWIIKTIKSTSIGFPLMVLAICFIRKGLDKIFTQYELSWLDHLLPSVSKKDKARRKASGTGMLEGPAVNTSLPVEMVDYPEDNSPSSPSSPVSPGSASDIQIIVKC